MSGSIGGVLRAIEQSSDLVWLRQCHDHNAKLGNLEIAEAASQRIRDLELEKALKVVHSANTLEGRIMESLRVYREVLKHKHGLGQRHPRMQSPPLAGVAHPLDVEAIRAHMVEPGERRVELLAEIVFETGAVARHEAILLISAEN